MVYIILTAQYDKEHNLCEVIKIGYTLNWEKRLSTYECYCHHLIVLKIYDEGTLEDETKLKKYFKDKVVYKDEWISYTEDILKFFKENDTLEKLRESLKEINPILPSKYIRKQLVNRFLVEYIYNNFCDPISDLLERVNKKKEIEKELYLIPESKHISYVSNKYSIPAEEITSGINLLMNNFIKTTDKVYIAIKEFNSLSSVKEKFKYLVMLDSKIENITEEDINNFLAQIPSKYEDYYRLLGPERIKANSFQESRIKSEWLKIHSGVDVDNGMISKIYETFKVGEKYGKSSIKSTLKEIYLNYNYNKTAKASDLQEYFVLKSTRALEEGVWVNGFEILGKR